MKNEYKTIIYDWVAKNFGESEADDPSWDIDALADELNNHFHEMYWQQELEYLKEDVDNYAKRNNYELTEQQAYQVADDIRNSEWYCCINPEDLEFYVQEELKRGE